MKHHIGLLLPRSVIYPAIAFDIVDGFRSSSDNSSFNNIELQTINISVANNYDAIYAKCEELLFAGVDVVIAYLNPLVAIQLQPLFASAKKILIILDAGYNCISISQLPNIFSISLQSTLCHRLLARLMHQNGHSTAAYVSSFFDSGYSGAYAFNCAAKELGGQITMHHITELNRRDFSLHPLLQHLAVNRNDVVMASFCGDMLQDFLIHTAQSKLAQITDIYLSPFGAEELWLDRSPYCGKDIDAYVPWAAVLQNEENKKFTAALTAKDRVPNIFSLLGWEAAIVAATVCRHTNITDAIENLENLAYESPRGHVTMDKDFHQTDAPLYHVKVIRNDKDTCSLSIIQAMTDIDDQRNKLKEDIIRLNREGTYWYNAYACLDS